MKRTLKKYSAWICVAIIIMLCGCGIKGNPALPSTIKGKGSVQNFEAISIPEGVALKWDMYKGDYSIDHVDLERSEVGSAGNECKDCPRKYEKIAEIRVKAFNQSSGPYNNLSFIDKKVVRGKTYNYRLLICNKPNNCIDGSAAEINY